MGKRIFLSDVHMGAKKKPQNGGTYDYDWLSRDDTKNLVDFLKYLLVEKQKHNNIDEIILLGDLLDAWICPFYDTPPSFAEIIHNNAEIINALAALAQLMPITYLEGNHDMGISLQDFNDSSLAGSENFKILGADKSYTTTDGIIAEHGHAYDLFNKSHQNGLMPLGYFISRLVAARGAKTGNETRHWWQYTDCLRSVLRKPLDRIIIETLMNDAGMKLDDNFVMPNDIKVKASTVIDTYHAPGYSYWAIGLDNKAANIVSNMQKSKIIFFGHTHNCKLTTLPIGSDDPLNIYVNLGTWCDQNKQYTYAETENNHYHHNVRLMQWHDKNTTQKELASINMSNV